jgi:hypothetical protein
MHCINNNMTVLSVDDPAQMLHHIKRKQHLENSSTFGSQEQNQKLFRQTPNFFMLAGAKPLHYR